MSFIENSVHYADILAIPLFLFTLIYFYNKKNKNQTEKILLFFSICGFIFDSLFTYQFIKNKV